MQLSTGGDMLNFGFWDESTVSPIDAQEKLCTKFAEFSHLKSAENILDVGSGLSAPAFFWAEKYPHLSITSVNINNSQLVSAKNKLSLNSRFDVRFINSTATSLPFADDSMDRILAFESAQHFKPLDFFISECKRILKSDGILSFAIPILGKDFSQPLLKLGILSMTWSSEHYSKNHILSTVSKNNFEILEEKLIGSNVYPPLADYYSKNRESIQKKILKNYSPSVEKILWRSIKKMRETSEKNIIDYLLLSCKKI
ncbi:MAG: class I SAM-dependent methyltransferase [Crenarchaeota archaeon]|nr:MAG: class I SAM-dependent methyltransferase [Thermoproteota archaeon]RDJ34318.1 MAG: class I SAM-dependent methyltransferase [Thermoproteota archaeon]RDJ37215.1 MAG: class I SAM-dependent methyltransferase [Thermoproteota archaeon]RDJ37903.1 MAG: class I SAM-dependent methyltransferase [Thermoproteota archaeon]